MAASRPINLRKARFAVAEMRAMLTGGRRYVEDINLRPLLLKLTEIERHIGGKYVPK